MFYIPTQLRIAGIIKESIVDGPGIRLVVFAQGCKHNCPGCHNPETHSFEGGQTISIEEILAMVKKNPLLDGVTLSGGDPFEQAAAFAGLAREIGKARLNVVTYTGYTYEYLMKHAQVMDGWGELLDETDILIDGRFELEKKSLMLKFRGSKNQRIIDVRRTRMENEIILLD